MNKDFSFDYIKELAEEMSSSSIISFNDFPQYDLFLSQVIDFLNDKFTEDKYTNNIVQNYIKSEVIMCLKMVKKGDIQKSILFNWFF